MKEKIILTFLLVFALASFVSAYCTTEYLTEDIIIEKMIWNIPELFGYTFSGVQEHCDAWEGYDLRYISLADRKQHNEFWLREYNTEQEAIKTFYGYFNQTPPSKITTKIINGNTILKQTIETEQNYMSYIWISGKNLIVSWNGDDIGSSSDIELMDILTEKYLQKYPSSYQSQINKIKEQVKCVFANSNEMQKCYTDDGKFGCSGTGTCVADVSGEKGKKLTWKSSCGGYGYTIIDGDNEYAEFKCASETNETIPVYVKEQVKCVFKNSDKEQKCYTAEDNSRFSCSGSETCVMDVNGKKGEKLTWKSTCGGYAYTITDGENEYAEFNCLPEGNTTTEIIGGRGFRYAYWQCYNREEQKQGSESSCKSSETWQSYAKEFCQDKCYKDGSKCGVNSFSVAKECYLDFEKPEVFFVPSIEEEEEKQEEKLTGKKEEILICKDSCPLDGKCYPLGYRKKNKFCSETGSFVEQLKGESSCDNNFECSTNLCINNKCVSEGFFQKVINWFKKLFG